MAGKRMVLGRHALVREVARALEARCRVARRARVLVATSGGADSVALLRAMAAITARRTWKLALAVGHVQHHLRHEAEQDAAFVEALARQLDLPYLRADLDLPAQGNVEANARRHRYHALAEMARTLDARYIATAHQGDDQLETMLMRLVRGASVKGLAGIRWRRRLGRVRPGEKDTFNPILIRPMLGVDHEQAIAFLRDLDQPWCEDHTNVDAARVRARLRRHVLPTLRRIRGDVARRAVRLGDQLRQASRLVDDAVQRGLDRVWLEHGAATIDRIEARQLPPPVLTGLLRRLLIDAGARADKLGQRTLDPVTRAILDGEGGQRRFALSGGVRVEVTRSCVRVCTPSNAAT